jgi:hypothetical protein
MAVSKAKQSAADLKRRIAARHPLAKSWAVFNEVCALSGSWGKAGSIDAIAVCLSAPRDFAVHGFEVKVNRSDWLNELNNPSKNMYAIDEVDYWWIVAPSVEIVHTDELPDKWGLYTCSGRGLRVTKRAKRLHEVGEPFSRPFVVSLLWKFSNWQHPGKVELQRIKREGYAEGRKHGEEHAKRDMKWDGERLQEMKQAADRFEAVAGYHINEYNAGRLGALAASLVDKTASNRLLQRIQSLQVATSNLKDAMEKAECQLSKRISSLLGEEKGGV